jgi:outer membrane receptor for ferrienterochelin and colicins
MIPVGNCILVALLLLCAAAAQTDKPPAPTKDEQALFGDLPTIEAAALHAQTLAEAPGNVSVITAEQIRRYGYKTLAEALASVRGFYVTYDHTYHFVGVSGISLPGDFNTRFLVMLNGHPLTDNIYNSNNFFAQDFGLDMDLVERIEIIRGPTSALYGSNGMLANINVVTRSPVDGPALRVSSENDTSGLAKVTASAALNLGHGANLLLSTAIFHSSGMSFPLDGLDIPAGATRPVSNADGERGYHTFANLIWRNWSFTAYLNSREKHPPVGLGTSLSGDPAQHVTDSRNLLGASYKRQIGPGEVHWQLYYDVYRYHDLFNYPVDEDVQPIHDYNRGDWLDTQFTYALPVSGLGVFTAGVTGSWDLRAQQFNLVDGERQDYTNDPDRNAALFVQQEWAVAPNLKLYGGLRLDESINFGHFLSPRLAAVWQYSPRTVYKFVYGHPFRNPSAFEQFYNDGGLSYTAAPPLSQEVAETFQVSMERKLASAWTLTVDGYRYRIRNGIEAVTLQDDVQQYRNSSGYSSNGVEWELSGRVADRLEVSASVTKQLAANASAWLANSPHSLAKARLGLPLCRDRLNLAGSWQYISARQSWTGDRLGGALLMDAVATWRLTSHFDVQGGIRNLFDRRYEDPIYLTVDRLRGDGRTAFLKLVWRVME